MSPKRKASSFLREPDLLPTIPAVALKVVELARDPEVETRRLARTLQADPALSAKMLRFANSAYYGAGQPISTLQQAVVRLGLRGTKLLALSFSLAGLYGSDEGEFDFGDFWQRSLSQSVIARRLALLKNPRLVEEAMLAGLLADIGSPLLARDDPQNYATVMLRYRIMHQDHAEVERALLGRDHSQLGGALLEEWGLPQGVCQAVQCHHTIGALGWGGQQAPPSLSAITLAAGELSSIILYGASQPRVRRLAEIFQGGLQLSADALRELIESVSPEVQQFAALLQLTVPPHDELERHARAEMLALALSAATSGDGAEGTAPEGLMEKMS